ncbi:hypothetical protein DY000_02016206 [Brassica cretica]|uniref:Uncharacterized protein n=1 Tax=Brassica cretica TaxID=69181 RepID=A0ABQ7DAE5_BRACR|nr:hypothetical protein DY000_02016206 [Brassica cretica]
MGTRRCRSGDLLTGTRRSGACIRAWGSLGTRNIWFFAGTVLRLPRKSLRGLEGAGVGVMTQVPGLRCFPRLEKQDLDCFLYFTVLLQ